MLSKSQISLFNSLQHKKFRKVHGLFVAEGYKSVVEFITAGYAIKTIYYTDAIDVKLFNSSAKINFQLVSVNEMAKLSFLNTPTDVAALIEMPAGHTLNTAMLKNRFSLVLDGVQDPGNMGTIIRTADWFGIEHIICSEDTVDVYNPKVVQATMGSLARVNVHYTNLLDITKQLQMPTFGAFLNGQNIYTTNFGAEGLIIMGNEGKGISTDLQQLIENPVTIPRKGRAESLNVAIATAIFCAELSRNRF